MRNSVDEALQALQQAGPAPNATVAVLVSYAYRPRFRKFGRGSDEMFESAFWCARVYQLVQDEKFLRALSVRWRGELLSLAAEYVQLFHGTVTPDYSEN